MGRIVHNAVIATTQDARPGGLPAVEDFRDSLPPEMQHLVVGPIRGLFNGYVSYAFMPDGSKEGWKPSGECDALRARFVALFDQEYSDGSSHDEVVELAFGEDHRDEHKTPAARYVSKDAA